MMLIVLFYSSSKLAAERSVSERRHQREISDVISSMGTVVIFDEQDEPINEFPNLDDQQQAQIRNALYGGSRNDVRDNLHKHSINRQLNHHLNLLGGRESFQYEHNAE